MKFFKTKQEAEKELNQAFQDMSFSDKDTFEVLPYCGGYMIGMFVKRDGKEYFEGYY